MSDAKGTGGFSLGWDGEGGRFAEKTERGMPIRHVNQGAWGTGATITILSFLVEIQGQTGR